MFLSATAMLVGMRQVLRSSVDFVMMMLIIIITIITTTSIFIIIIIIMCVGGNAQVVRSRGWILWGSKHHASPNLTNIPHTQDGLCTIQFFCSSTYLKKMVGGWVGGSHRRRSNSDEGGDQHHCGGNTPDKLSWVHIFAAKISNRLNFFCEQVAILYELSVHIVGVKLQLI